MFTIKEISIKESDEVVTMKLVVSYHVCGSINWLSFLESNFILYTEF